MPDSRYILTPENYDGVTSALLGNGELCTTVGPTGFHTPPDQQTDISHRTQHFVMAGRRRPGPQHPLVNLGTICRMIVVNGLESMGQFTEQEIFTVTPGVQHEFRDEWRCAIT